MCTEGLPTDITESSSNRITSWFEVNWKEVNKSVVKFRKRIFAASRRRELKRLRQLQRLAGRSEAVTLFAVRHVTYNSGKATPGVDQTVAITPEDRIKLVHEILSMNWADYQPLPVKRVYVQKPDGRQRPLGIPAIKDRVIQMIVKITLEPEWEAKFENSSYGFRPMRSVNDAMNRLYVSLNKGASRKWIVDADISLCFDSISHNYLLTTLEYFPYKDVIEKWLKAGVVIGSVWFETDEGTPQGSVISPLLSNIALHGIESELGIQQNSKGYTKTGGRSMVRYADDFVVLCYSKMDAEQVLIELNGILGKRGLTISKLKTKIVHVCEGFDFLGFNVKLSPSEKYYHDAIVKVAEDYQIEFSKVGLYIHPAKKSVESVKNEIRRIFKDNHGSSAENLISKLNPVIRGWATSKKCWHSNRTFHDLDHFLFNDLWAWCSRQHPNKTKGWIKNRYFKHLKFGPINNQWVFTAPGDSKLFLYQFKWFPVEMHIMVKNEFCPDDATQEPIPSEVNSRQESV